MKQVINIILNEFRYIFHDAGVILILVFAPIIYATIYSLTYGTQVLRNIPIGVIDNDHTPASRKLINTFSAGPNAYVAYEPSDMEDAKRLFFNRDIYGIAYIPNGYERSLMNGSGANVAIYLDASYMLMYRQVFQDMVASISTSEVMIEFQRLIAEGAEIPQAKTISQPIKYTSHTLFNPYLGYGSFVMPPIIILILQQTLLIGIGMIGGTWHERGVYTTLGPTQSALHLIIGKTICYFTVYAILALYLLNVHYRLFHYPINGSALAISLFIGLYLLSSILLGIALSTLFRHRETPLMLLLWTSIPLLMLSGASFPSSAIPRWLQLPAIIFPSTFGTRGFIKLQTMGATLNDVIPEIIALATMAIIYSALAYIGIRHITNNKKRQ